VSQNGSGPAAIVNQDGTVNSSSAPAPKGRGAAVPDRRRPDQSAGADGQLALDVCCVDGASVTVSIGAFSAQVLYSGVAPQSIAGFTQFNVVVPQERRPVTRLCR